MDIVNIQALIRERRVVTLSDINPNESYVQIGIWQPGNRKAGPSDPNAYKQFVIPISQLGVSGGGVWGTITGILSSQTDLQAALDAKQNVLGFVPYPDTNPDGYITAAALPLDTTLTFTVDLNTTSVQVLGLMPAGLFIIEKAYVSQASIDLSSSPVNELVLYNSGIPIAAPWTTTSATLFSSLQPGPCGPLGCSDILNTLSLSEMYAVMYTPSFACFPPPCNAYTITGGESLNVQLTTATGVPATIKIHIVIRKIG